MRGSVQEPRVEGRCTMGPIVFEGRRIESLAATVSLSPQEGIAREVKVESQGTLIEGNARVGWRNWIPGQDSDLDAAFSIQNLKIERLLSEAGGRFPATGTVSGALRVTGTIGSPEAAGRLQLTAVSLYGQRFEKGSIEARFDGGVLNLASAKLDDGQLHIEGSGAYVPRKGDWRSGPVRFEIAGRRLAVSRLRIGAARPARTPEVFRVQDVAQVALRDQRRELIDVDDPVQTAEPAHIKHRPLRRQHERVSLHSRRDRYQIFDILRIGLQIGKQPLVGSQIGIVRQDLRRQALPSTPVGIRKGLIRVR